MGEIYTAGWYDEVKEAINGCVAGVADTPTDDLVVAIEIEGDGNSPYVADGGTRRFLIRLEAGSCAWYREIEADDPDVRLDFRFTGPATAFDEIAAAILDPIDAALEGTIRVRGDMRYLMRHAQLVQVLLVAESFAHCFDGVLSVVLTEHRQMGC